MVDLEDRASVGLRMYYSLIYLTHFAANSDFRLWFTGYAHSRKLNVSAVIVSASVFSEVLTAWLFFPHYLIVPGRCTSGRLSALHLIHCLK